MRIAVPLQLIPTDSMCNNMLNARCLFLPLPRLYDNRTQRTAQLGAFFRADLVFHWLPGLYNIC